MMKQIYSWYKRRSVLQQLLISFGLNWIVWLIADLIGNSIFFDEKRSANQILFDATFMAFFATCITGYYKIKSLFKKKKAEEI